MNVREPAAQLGRVGFRMAVLNPGQAESSHGGTHAVGELEPPPRRRPPQQFDQHALDLGGGIGRLRSHHGMIVTSGGLPVEQLEFSSEGLNQPAAIRRPGARRSGRL